MRGFRDALVVARFDLGESLRSRKALIFLALYVAGAVGAVVLLSFLSRWRARSRVGRVEAKSVFRDDDF